VEVGSRIEVAGVTGDIIDIGLLKITVLEVGNLVYGRQSTGRLITIPNYQLLSANVMVSGPTNPFVWQEVRITVPFDSDWQRAEAILRETGDELHAEIEPELQAGFRRLEKRYAFKYGTLTPIVYVTLGTSGVELTLRFLTHVRRRRGSEDLVARRLLAAFAAEPGITFAHPTTRVLRHGERGTGLFGEEARLEESET
jgi:small-conductance mechanosensitive channel